MYRLDGCRETKETWMQTKFLISCVFWNINKYYTFYMTLYFVTKPRQLYRQACIIATWFEISLIALYISAVNSIMWSINVMVFLEAILILYLFHSVFCMKNTYFAILNTLLYNNCYSLFENLAAPLKLRLKCLWRMKEKLK